MKTVITLVCFLASFFAENGVQGAQILVINPMPSYSHFIIPFKIAKELAERGHKITHVTAYPQKEKISNFKEISVVENIASFEERKKVLMSTSTLGPIQAIGSLFDMAAMITNNTIQHKNVQNLIQSNAKFDVVLIEYFCDEAFVGFGHIFKAPVVLINSQAASALSNFIFANPAPASYVPNVGGTFSKRMNFWQRLTNLASSVFFGLMQQFYHLPQQRNIFKSFIKDIELDDVLYNTSLMLTNSHPSFSNPNPLVHGIIEVGGLHITPKKIPKHLEKFLDEAKEGVILFSMGSNLKSQDLKPEDKSALLKAFAKLKEKVLWKFETELPEVPSNVKIMDWIPQTDVLAHPNVKAFITHGGRLSTIEAVYFGVPIIGIPVFGDQMSNIAAAVLDGYALQLSLNGLTDETLSETLNEILQNPKYKQNVKHRSRLLHDEPLKAMDKAVFWIEHVIRQKGAPHFRSAGLDLTWYQRELIDVLGFIAFIVNLTILVTFYFCKKIYNVIFNKIFISKQKKRQ